jgi:hypothetical protein
MADTTTEVRPFKGWWTLGAAVGVAALGAFQTYITTTGGAGLIPIPYVGPTLIAVGFAMAYLRSITDTKVGASK